MNGDALYVARVALLEGIANYVAEQSKQCAKTYLYIGDLDRAIFNTRVALYIGRLKRHV